MAAERSSAFNFSDSNTNALDQHPDMPVYSSTAVQPGHLSRNKTERRRLQGLQRSNTALNNKVKPEAPRTIREKFNIWMINEGGRRLFFTVWIILHLLVAVFGFFNYQLKDNLVGARQIFGVTYRAFPYIDLRTDVYF